MLLWGQQTGAGGEVEQDAGLLQQRGQRGMPGEGSAPERGDGQAGFAGVPQGSADHLGQMHRVIAMIAAIRQILVQMQRERHPRVEAGRPLVEVGRSEQVDAVARAGVQRDHRGCPAAAAAPRKATKRVAISSGSDGVPPGVVG
jgi:hypothetical protein